MTSTGTTAVVVSAGTVPKRQCPCENFTSLSKLVETLDSQQAMQSLIDWLDGRTDDLALEQQQQLSCGKRSRCRFRYGTSFAILNAIRDACRPYLEVEENTTETYEEKFPSLQPYNVPIKETKAHPAVANILMPPNHGHPKLTYEEALQKPKEKKRIRPAQVTEPAHRDNTIWNTAPNVWGNGNVATLSSQGSLLPVNKISVLSSIQSVTTPSVTVVTLAPTTTTTSTQNEAPHQLENLVTIYVALFRNMLVPSTPLELHFLIRLLVLESNAGSIEDVSYFQPILADPESCQRFAVLALSQLKTIMRNLPTSLLQALVECEPFQNHCTVLAQELSLVLIDHRVKGLLIDYPTEAVTGTHAIFSLPFDHERDSRHNFKTPTETAVYNNRELIRDAFLGALRNFINTKGSLHERAQERVRTASKEIFNVLMTVNGTWFAQFYCELLLQVGLSPLQETDQELLNIADKDKLQVSGTERIFCLGLIVIDYL